MAVLWIVLGAVVGLGLAPYVYPKPPIPIVPDELTLRIPRDELYLRARFWTAAYENVGGPSLKKYHDVRNRLEQEFPSRRKRDVSKAIEMAMEKLA